MPVEHVEIHQIRKYEAGLLFAERRVVGVDVVELAPIPGVVAPDFLAAKLVYKLVAYQQRARRARGG